jgi:hypothetical protein
MDVPERTDCTGIPFSEIKFELFAFIGLITGSGISFFAMRQNKKSKDTL